MPLPVGAPWTRRVVGGEVVGGEWWARLKTPAGRRGLWYVGVLWAAGACFRRFTALGRMLETGGGGKKNGAVGLLGDPTGMFRDGRGRRRERKREKCV